MRGPRIGLFHIGYGTKKRIEFLPSQNASRILSKYLPRLGLSALILCIVSGLILIFYYKPFGNVFKNVEEITTLVPFGWFFRQLHYASGEAFVILMLLHTADHFLKKRYTSYSQKEWTLLVLSLAVCLFILFTGFILKGDKEGVFAGHIFANIIKELPFFGGFISRLFIERGEAFFFLPYLYHCFFLPVIVIYLLRAHIREWLPNREFMGAAALGVMVYAIFVEPAPAVPTDADVEIVEGPWFFLGIQTMLKFLPALWAGLLIPGMFLGCVLILPKAGRRLGRGLYWTVTVSCCTYLVLILRGLLWGP